MPKRTALKSFRSPTDCTENQYKIIISKFNRLFIKTEYCWNWNRKPNNEGYGYFVVCGFILVAHRAS